MPIGLYLVTEALFTSIAIQIQVGAIIYSYKGGHANQFAEPKREEQNSNYY
jgi:hypothetical protein